MLVLYSLTIFLSAFLLFSIQPIIGKALLPILGGTPSVWNVCMTFFQILLFMGYLYADRLVKVRKTTSRVGTIFFHLSLLMLAAYLLPNAIPGATAFGSITVENHFILWLMLTLVTWIGVPFFSLASTSTIIQTWYPKNPYFLYAASNAGSLFALISYPFIVEPHLSVSNQVLIWKWMFWILAVLIAACSLLASPGKIVDQALKKSEWKQKGVWLLCALIPSSLLLGVTTYISTDIAAIPLLWMIPLVLYLLSFILVYSKAFHAIKKYFYSLGRALGFGAILCVVGICVGVNHPSMLFIPLHLIVFFLACLLCHGKLADAKPDVELLSQYYLYISLGGMLGGISNSLLMPLVFNDVVEYPVSIVLACWIRSWLDEDNENAMDRKDWLNAGVVFLLVLMISSVCNWFSIPPGRGTRLLVLGFSIILCYRKVKFPKSYAVSLAALYLAAHLFVSSYGHEIFKTRTFFGTTRVVNDQAHQFMVLYHGSTLHGQQKIGSTVPLTYYHPTGPVGDIFKVTQSIFSDPQKTQIGVVGMGTGSIASYARESEKWTYYELDPAIVQIANQKEYFTFLSESKIKNTMETLTGDARMMLKDTPDGQYSLLMMDAFSSDSIPTHLITHEAVALEWSKVSLHGILAFHVSNRYFDLAPVMMSLAQESSSVAFLAEDYGVTELETETTGKTPSRWVVMVKSLDLEPFLAALPKTERWKRIDQIPMYSKLKSSKNDWNDQYFNLISLFR